MATSSKQTQVSHVIFPWVVSRTMRLMSILYFQTLILIRDIQLVYVNALRLSGVSVVMCFEPIIVNQCVEVGFSIGLVTVRARWITINRYCLLNLNAHIYEKKQLYLMK